MKRKSEPALKEKSQVQEETDENQAESAASSEPAHRKNVIWREIRSYGLMILIAVVVAWVLNHKIIVNAEVPTTSMEATVMRQDRIIVNRLAYNWSEPQRGDIVMFKFPDDETEDYLKRIIGLPGETVEIIDGWVYIDGEYLEEDYLMEEPVPEDAGPFQVPDGCYFMMGDNRNISLDSRYWQNPYVAENKILGKAIVVYYPKWRSLD